MTGRFERALVALELSAAERGLFERLADLRKLGVRSLLLVHVGSYHVSRRAHNVQQRVAEAELEAIAERLRADGMAVKLAFRVGEPALEIDRLMREQACDLLVVGLRTVPVFGRRSPGATPRDLARVRDWPMLLLGASTGSRLVLATDLSASARNAEVTALALADWAPVSRNGQTDIGKIDQVAAFAKPAVVVSVMTRRQLTRHGVSVREARLRNRFTAPAWTVAVRSGRPVTEIAAEAADSDAGLLVIGRSRRTRLRALSPGRLAWQLSARLRCDVLLVPESGNVADGLRVPVGAVA